jgi:magnesium-transporting ATPase (P-type)
MVIPPILPTAILIGLNVSGEPLFELYSAETRKSSCSSKSPSTLFQIIPISVLRLKVSGIKTFQVKRVAVIGGCKVMCFDKTGTITEDGLSFSGIWLSSTAPLHLDGGKNTPLHVGACVLDNICSSSKTAAMGEKILALQIVGSHDAAGMGICHSLVMLDGQLQV